MTIKEFDIQVALGTLSFDIKYELADNKKTSKGILIKLSTDENKYIRWYIAQNTNTPTKVLKKLSIDKEWDTRYWVAVNPNTPKEIREKLIEEGILT